MHPHPPAGRVANALAGETSPYLLQHAFNPVAWRPWGEAAIREARTRDLPLFVSIGYSTCHWCHVMERESFESEAVAELLNRDFVPVKVDREERPDVDEVYMTACQAFTRMTEGRASGGWPLSAWVDPHSLKPFWVGTYFPPVATHGRPSFTHLLDRLAAAWRERREEVDAQAGRIGAAIAAELELVSDGGNREAVSFRTLAERAAAALVGYADFTHGGFGGAPKFPQPPFLSLVEAFGGEQGKRVVDAALEAMVLGGIHDQVGGGFHRYAVDASWTVPHFEKMLYDQALLLPFLARRAAAGDALHRHAAGRLVAFLERELTEPDGAFRSALDAEAGGREGEPYAWTGEAFAAAFGGRKDEGLAAAERLYGMGLGPNFRDPHHEDSPPMRVLRIERRADASAALAARDRFDGTLLEARGRRPQPAIDDKVIASWNGLMIAGLAEAGVAMGRRDWIGLARRAFAATLARLGPVESLRRTARAGVTSPIAAQLEDVGALALAAATLGEVGLARSILDLAERDFAAPGGGWFDAPLDAGPAALFVRSRSLSDGAVPAGNTLVAAAIVRMLRISPDADLAIRLGRAARAFAPTVAANPTGSALLLAELAAAEAEGLLPPADADPCADGACRT